MNGIGDPFVIVPSGVTATVGSVVSNVTEALFDTVLLLPATSWAAAAMTWQVTAPSTVGVTGIV